MGKIKDISGQKFDMLTVLCPTDERTSNREVIWECQCECGNIIYTSTSSLRKGNRTSCGCKKHNPKENLIGKTFSKLTVIEQTSEIKNGGVVWKCQCECGNITYVATRELKRGNTKSCGCLNKKDLTGQRFGKLVVLEEAEKDKTNRVKWKCVCDCGNITTVQTANLTGGNTTSCGCLVSKGEYEIQQLLQANGINYQKEYTFDDLKDQFLLRFDFAVFDNNNNLQYLIEFDGEQHFTVSGWNDLAHYEKVKLHDQMKDNYCKEHNIPLIRIPYTKRGNLTIKDLIIN